METPDLRPLGWSRAALGLLFLIRTTPLLAPLHLSALSDTSPLLGWPDDRWHGAAVGVALPPSIVASLCVVRTAAAAAFMLGIAPTAAGLAAGAAGYIVLAQRPFGFLFTFHLLYLGTILLALTDAGSAFALRPRPARSPASSLLLMRLFVASIYAWAAIGKLRPDWLDGRALAVLHDMQALTGPLADVLLATPARRAMTSCAVALGELSLGPLLLWRRTRPAALGAAYFFHIVIEIMGRPDLLGWETAALLLCFLPGVWGRRRQSGEQRADGAGQAMRP